MSADQFFLPEGYTPNPAATFDADEARYWTPSRLDNSLAYQAAVYQWASRLVQERGLNSVADFGCGVAAKLAKLHAALPAVEVWGLDQPNAVELCRRHYDFGNWFELDLDRPSELPSEKFDLVVSSDAIEHLDNPDRLLDAIRSAVHESSLVLLSTPERIRLRGPDSRRPPNAYHVREWSKEEFAHYLESRNFEVLEHRLLPAFNPIHNFAFFRRAMRRWLRFRTLDYNQAVLARVRI